MARVTEREAFEGIQGLFGPCPKCGTERCGTERCKSCGFQELDDPHWPYERWCPVCESQMTKGEPFDEELNLYNFTCPNCGKQTVSEWHEPRQG